MRSRRERMAEQFYSILELEILAFPFFKEV